MNVLARFLNFCDTIPMYETIDSFLLCVLTIQMELCFGSNVCNREITVLRGDIGLVVKEALSVIWEPSLGVGRNVSSMNEVVVKVSFLRRSILILLILVDQIVQV